MRYCGDDLNRVVGMVGRSNPGMIRFMRDPFIRNEIAGMMEDAELMGFDLDDPEMMGGLIDGIKKIASAIRKRREARKKSGETTSAPAFSVQTPQGTAALGPQGFSWTGSLPQSLPIATTGYQIAPVQQSESIIDKVKKNPALLGLAAIPVLMLIMAKRSQKK